MTIAEVLKDWGGEIARFNMLRTHYRQPIDWTSASMDESADILRAWKVDCESANPTEPDEEVLRALEDDLNSHAAFTKLHQLAKLGDMGKLRSSLLLLGFGLTDAAVRRTFNEVVIDKVKATDLVSARLAARLAKDWKKSDEIRDELAAMGIQIKDVKDPATGELKTEWEVKR